MPNEYDNRLITKLTIAMECFEDFHKNYEDQKIRKKYYLALDDVFDFLEKQITMTFMKNMQNNGIRYIMIIIKEILIGER